MLFSLGFYPQVSINNPTSSVRRGIVEPGPQYYLPMEMTAKLGPVSLDGEIGRWIGNANQPEQWGRGLIAGHEFSDRLELYGEVYDLQAIDRVRTQPKQRSLTLFMGGRAIQQVTTQNGEPSWIAYMGVQFLLGPKEKEVPGQTP
jgi:hypothetical protein